MNTTSFQPALSNHPSVAAGLFAFGQTGIKRRRRASTYVDSHAHKLITSYEATQADDVWSRTPRPRMELLLFNEIMIQVPGVWQKKLAA